ncbi:hypothetical protein KBTX_03273 [wastewater metagenome]|uniref:Sulfotransferase family n=2 Tax=unclassified sequences TaxID=12908 RepID=A0A5B8RDJ1_9ZZZZ|nr:sulfotransferase [Arhodomonas sp. KWT]QEA06930.1 hypothetical protein KBTEX_03273 [uncultured organism]
MSRESRTKSFDRNPELEALLAEVNGRLAPANNEVTADSGGERLPKIFVHGALRSGTTMFMQWLAQTGQAAYPTNLLSRFYGAPLVGARIQQLLTDPRYNFRDEILDFNSEIDFRSENGKTRGALSPNEFWYFWRRFLPFDELDYLPEDELVRHGHLDGLRDELNALANVFERPFALKAMIMNQNIPALSARFDNALFVHIHRDPVFNIQSALEARKRQYGDIRQWYSFRIREYPDLKDLDPLESVAGQIAAINRSIEIGMRSVPAHRRLTIAYEDFCKDPRGHHEGITERLSALGLSTNLPDYNGPDSFQITNQWRLVEYSRQEVEAAWSKMQKWAYRAIPG